MDWPDDLAESLPAPQDDEGASLRQDIADELGDHLQSALARQLPTTPDADEARAQVLARFGDPLAVARQLWFDAFKEQLMSQRLMLVLTAVMAVICVAAVVATWIVIRQSSAAMAEVVAESRAANDALRAQLEQATAAAAKPIDWKPPLNVQLVLGEIDGPPAAGYKAVLRYSSRSGESQLEPVAQSVADANGEVDFGPLKPVDYVLNVYTPWEEFHQRLIDHHPGEARLERIVCPTAAASPEEAEIKVSVDWPEDLRDKGLSIIGRFAFAHGQRRIADTQWTTAKANSLPGVDLGTQWLVFESDDQTRIVVEPRPERFPRLSYYPFQPAADGTYGLRVDAKRSRFYFGMEDELPAVPSVHWPRGTYRLHGLAIALPTKDPKQDGVRQLDVMALSWTQGRPLDETPFRSAGREDYEQIPPLVAISASNQPQFEAAAGQSNSWQLTLPEKLLKHVRERLAMK